MSNPARNSVGTLVGEHGYVLCRVCMIECDTLSRETPPELAECTLHRQITKKQKESAMPRVPKPSQKEKSTAPHTPKAEKIATPKQPRAARVPREKGPERYIKTSHGERRVPSHGNLGRALTGLTERGSVTMAELIAECSAYGVKSEGGIRDAAYYAKKLGLLKE